MFTSTRERTKMKKEIIMLMITTLVSFLNTFFIISDYSSYEPQIILVSILSTGVFMYLTAICFSFRKLT